MRNLISWLPRRLISFWVGKIMHWRGPLLWRWATIWSFARLYKINCEEAEFTWTEYPSLGDFFCRRLKPGLRPTGSGKILHPADSVIAQCGPLDSGRLIQAKGIFYGVQDLTADINAMEKWGRGFFMTYYLCPTDYHRVHSPVSGKIVGIRHICGDLFPVNQWSCLNTQGLFVRNERVVLEIQTDQGPVALVMVGATNVGSIVIHKDPELSTNRPEKNQGVFDRPLPLGGIPVVQGEDLGMFRMGSTVVMVYPETLFQNQGLKAGLLYQQKVWVGTSVNS